MVKNVVAGCRLHQAEPSALIGHDNRISGAYHPNIVASAFFKPFHDELSRLPRGSQIYAAPASARLAALIDLFVNHATTTPFAIGAPLVDAGYGANQSKAATQKVA